MKCLAGKISSSSLLSTYSPVSRLTTLIASISSPKNSMRCTSSSSTPTNSERIAAHAERAAHEIDIVAAVLHVDELAQQNVAVDLLADAHARRHLHVVRRRAQAEDARDRGDDQRIGARQQRLRRRVAQTLDLVVDRAVLFDVGVGRRRRTLRADSSRSTKRNTRPRSSGRTRGTRRRAGRRASCCGRARASAFCTSSTVRAIAIVLPLPVTPSSVWMRSPRRTPAASASVASG